MNDHSIGKLDLGAKGLEPMHVKLLVNKLEVRHADFFVACLYMFANTHTHTHTHIHT